MRRIAFRLVIALGFVLVIGAAGLAYLTSETHNSPQPGELIRESYTDLHLRLPGVLIVGSLVATGIAIWLLRPKDSH